MPARLPEITIIRDSREHDNHGWMFDEMPKKAGRVRVVGTIEQGLDAGDYTVKGLEDKVVIERKNGFAELIGNYSKSEHRSRFEREMERMSHIPHRYIIVETSLSQDIMTLGCPQQRNGPPVKSIVKWLIKLEIQYGVKVIYAGECGKKIASWIFEEVARQYRDELNEV